MTYITVILTGAAGLWLLTSGGAFDMAAGVVLLGNAVNSLALRVDMNND